MTKTALTIMADGFEDIEGIAPIDVLKRVEVEVTLAGLKNEPIKGTYGSVLTPQISVEKIEALYDAIIFPGGRRNAHALAQNPKVIELIHRHHREGKIVAAICASPSHVLGEAAQILKGRRATGDPSFSDRLAASGAIVTDEDLTVDGNIITARGPGAAMLFALMLAEQLAGKDQADKWAAYWRITR